MSYPDTPTIESHARSIAMLPDESVAWKLVTAEGDMMMVNVNVVVPMSGTASVAV
jgi:hypothetical protein